MDIDRDKVAISNGALKEETPLDDGKKRVTFEKTPKMSTYLVFFGVGAFEFTQDTEDPRVRMATLPGMKPYAMFGLAFGRKSLAFSEKYYGIPYPLPKMDPILRLAPWKTGGRLPFVKIYCCIILRLPQNPAKSASVKSSPTKSPISGSATWSLPQTGNIYG
jgi:hypothetical protein